MIMKNIWIKYWTNKRRWELIKDIQSLGYWAGSMHLPYGLFVRTPSTLRCGGMRLFALIPYNFDWQVGFWDTRNRINIVSCVIHEDLKYNLFNWVTLLESAAYKFEKGKYPLW